MRRERGNRVAYMIGVDIGGTKRRAGIVSEAGQVLGTVQLETPAGAGSDAVLTTCCEAVRRLQASEPGAVAGVGVASAGRIDRRGVVAFSTATFRGWQGADLHRSITERIGLPVTVENDANAAAVAEAWIGAAADCESVALITLGTGVGGGLVEHGRLVHGKSGGAAEIGHLLYRAGERRCPCGYAGCFEPYLSVRALADEYARVAGGAANGKAVFSAYRAGNSDARGLVAGWMRTLASLVFSVQNAYDPECIVIGGGVIESAAAWWADFHAGLAELPISVRVRPAALRADAAVVGAARLAWLESNTREGSG